MLSRDSRISNSISRYFHFSVPVISSNTTADTPVLSVPSGNSNGTLGQLGFSRHYAKQVVGPRTLEEALTSSTPGATAQSRQVLNLNLRPGEKAIKTIDVSQLDKLGKTPEFEALEKAAKAPDASNEAILAYAKALFEGRGAPIDLSLSCKLFKELSDKQYPPAMVQYAVSLIANKVPQFTAGPEKAQEEAVKILKVAADPANTNYHEAQFLYASWLQALSMSDSLKDNDLQGKTTNSKSSSAKKYEEDAAKYYKLAADNGNVDSMLIYAACLRNGSGVKKDLAQGEKYYQKAANAGSADGQYYYGVCLHSRGMYEEAVQYFEKAAAQNHAEAVSCLAVAYAHGQGVKKDLARAASLSKLAADSGSSLDMLNYGISLATGLGIPKDIPEAKRYLRMAADFGSDEAMNRLGALFVAEFDQSQTSEAKTSETKSSENSSEKDSGKKSENGVKSPIDEGIEWFQKAVALGNSHAMVNLAQVLFQHKKDEKGAADLLKRAYQARNPEGARAWFQCLVAGMGVERNEDEAKKVLADAAQWGDPELLYMHAVYGLTFSHKDYLPALQRAADAGFHKAQNDYGVAVYSQGDKKGHEEGMRYVKMAADAGFVEAETNYGKMCLENSKELDGVQYLERAAAKGNAQAAVTLGFVYLNGQGDVKKNEKRAVVLMKGAAEADEDERAIYSYAVMLIDGVAREVSRADDRKKGMGLMLKVANRGMPQAMYMYAWGLSEEASAEESKKAPKKASDEEKAKKIATLRLQAAQWTAKAAEKGLLPAIFTYAYMLQQGQGVEINKAEAAKYYEIAAEKGMPEAQYNLAMMYGLGDGVKQDLKKAKELLKLAADQGHQDAKQTLKSLK